MLDLRAVFCGALYFVAFDSPPQGPAHLAVASIDRVVHHHGKQIETVHHNDHEHQVHVQQVDNTHHTHFTKDDKHKKKSSSGAVVSLEEVHRRGLLHRGAWLYVLNDRRELLLAHARNNVKVCPSQWVLPTVHPTPKERPATAAARTLQQRFNWTVDPLDMQPFGRKHFFKLVYAHMAKVQGRHAPHIENQLTSQYVYHYVGEHGTPSDLAKAAKRDSEVFEYRFWPLEDVLEAHGRKPDQFCPTMFNEFLFRRLKHLCVRSHMHDSKLCRTHLERVMEKLGKKVGKKHEEAHKPKPKPKSTPATKKQ